MDARTALLDAAHAAFVESGVSIIVAARDAANTPALARAVGCRVSPDRRRVTVFVAAAQAAEVLDGLQANREVAAVFCQPSTHRTIQLKGRDAARATVEPDDLARIDAQAERFADDLARLAYPKALALALVAYAPADLVAIDFTPSAAFAQTPGPRAGERLAG